jgi:hypothetical protein
MEGPMLFMSEKIQEPNYFQHLMSKNWDINPHEISTLMEKKMKEPLLLCVFFTFDI